MQTHDCEQNSDEWIALRLGLPTASEFSKIITSTGEPSKSASTYAMTLAAELFAGQRVDAFEGNQWTERGHEMEELAATSYAFATNLDLVKVGFVTTDDGLMGCSPDRLAGETGLVEFKGLKAENHIKTILYWQKHGKCPPDYVQQVQGQLLICERAWCDLVFYHDLLPTLTIRIEPDAKVQDAIKAEVPKLLEERDRVLEAIKQQAGG